MQRDRSIGGRHSHLEDHVEVSRLPRRPRDGELYWLNSTNGVPDHTHGLFKFPAKFHVPVVEWALGTFGRRGSTVLDPFTGSGTVQVEAQRRLISSVGVDIDPLAVFITKVKTTPLDPRKLRRTTESILAQVDALEQNRGSIQDTPGGDISKESYDDAIENLEIPCIPNINHWFRRYVIIDLALIKAVIQSCSDDDPSYRFLLACFAGIIRKVSNADPAPVSGLEVTSHQARRNLARRIRVFREFREKLTKETVQQEHFWRELSSTDLSCEARVIHADAAELSGAIDPPEGGFPLVVTSPPYCRSVEYGRRHRLELFWLGFVDTAEDHVSLTHQYIGRDYVRVKEWENNEMFGLPELDIKLQSLRDKDRHRYRSVHHYFAHMSLVLEQLHCVMKSSGTLVLVVGNSVCAGITLATADYLAELAHEHFRLNYRFRYEIRNHYMQYGLWNGDGIKEEHVLVMKPRR